jgi:hypothetical protein
MVFMGIPYMQNEFLGEADYSFKNIKKGGMALMISYLFIIPAINAMGYFVVKRRVCHGFLIGVWGFLLFFIIAIPLMTEASLVFNFDNTPGTVLQHYCNRTHNELISEHGQIYASLFDMAHRLDQWSIEKMNEYMCNRNMCPCLIYKNEEGGPSSYDVYRNYFKENPETLEFFNRSFEPPSDKNPYNNYEHLMYFDSRKGFKSFKNCYEFHEIIEKEGKTDINVDEFKVDIKKFRKQPEEYGKDTRT